MTRDLAELLSEAHALLLDFDGPVCSVYAGRPDHIAADAVRLVLRDAGITLPAAIEATPDPLEVLIFVSGLNNPTLVASADDALIDAELKAIEVAQPTPGAADTIRAATRAGKLLGIVSNNSQEAIEAYLARHELAGFVPVVVGRAYGRPGLMKPNPHPLREAASQLHQMPRNCVLVGDSTTDIVGAHAAGMACIGYANRAEKAPSLAAAGAAVIVGEGGMRTLANCFRATGNSASGLS